MLCGFSTGVLVEAMDCDNCGGPAARFRHALRGTAALEFAIVAPIMLLMIVGIMMFGLYLTLCHEVQELASSGARASVAGLNQAERNTLAQSFINNFVSLSGLLVPADLAIATATTGTPATSYQVSVTYNLKDTPIPALGKFVNLPSTSIQRTAVVQFGGY
jgi:Flp pilus assembly protein TadG